MNLKTSMVVLWLSSLICGMSAPITIEEFEKLDDPEDREKAIAQAPPEIRPALKKISTHKSLVKQFETEEELRHVKEGMVALRRGVGYLENLSETRWGLWNEYAGSVYAANEAGGMAKERQGEVEKEMRQRLATEGKLVGVAHRLVFRLAPTPKALALAKEAEVLVNKLDEKYILNSDPSRHLITYQELAEVDRQVARIFDEVKKLPSLSSKEAQAEYDAFPEEDIPPDK